MDQPSQQSIHSLKAKQYRDSFDSTEVKTEPKVEIDEINEVLNLIELKGFQYLDKFFKSELEKIKEQMLLIDKNNLMLFQGMAAGIKLIYKRIEFLKQQRKLYSPDKR